MKLGLISSITMAANGCGTNALYHSFDTFMSTRVESPFGEIEVSYAVYRYGVVAHVDVTLTGCRFPSATTVYGLITAQNSMLGEDGKSFLFNRDDVEGICIDVSPCEDMIVQLPLARSKTVVPFGSSLIIDVNIRHCSIIGAQVQPIAEYGEFEFVARLIGREVKTFRGAACQVNVGVTWSHHNSYA